ARSHLHLQARADPGDGVRVAAQAHAPAAARARRPGAGRTLPRARRVRAEVVARHAEAAGLAATAATYYQRAGERARDRSAHEEAITEFRKAIALVETLPAGRERDAREAGLQMALGTTLMVARGFAHAESEAAYERAQALCEATGDSETLASVLTALAGLYAN